MKTPSDIPFLFQGLNFFLFPLPLLQLDRLTVASRLPNWVDGELKYTFVRDNHSDQILLFKEISWETTRLEADGLRDLQLTPVKLITNACRVRITLKKRLSGELIRRARGIEIDVYLNKNGNRK